MNPRHGNTIIGMEKVLQSSPFWVDDSPSWLRRNRLLVAVLGASFLLHLAVAGTLSSLVRQRESDLARRIAEAEAKQTVEFEIVTPPPAADKKPAPMAEAAPPAPARPTPPPKTANRIVELPMAPEQKPDHANYLAERDMRADKETIASKIGDAENRKQAGVTNGQSASPELKEKIEAKAKIEQRDGSTGPARAGDGSAVADRGAAEGGETLEAGGDGVLLKAGPTAEARGARTGGGGQVGTPEVTGRDALMPSPQQLAKLIEPAQKNLLQVQHGDITVLNARSSELAAYIIASAKRIYSFLNINGPLLTVYYDDVRDLKWPIAVEAEIDRKGRIVQLATIASSGSMKIDRLVSDATKSGLASAAAPPNEGFEDGDFMKFRFALYGDHIEAGLP